MDDEDYEEILEDKLDIDDDGFPIEYQDWDVPFGNDETGTGWIIEIDGDDWLRKYSRGNNADFTAISRTGNIGLTMFGITGLINSVLGCSIWFLFLY